VVAVDQTQVMVSIQELEAMAVLEPADKVIQAVRVLDLTLTAKTAIAAVAVAVLVDQEQVRPTVARTIEEVLEAIKQPAEPAKPTTC
jgi:hypothetical protein